jgi:hypothetical protein
MEADQRSLHRGHCMAQRSPGEGHLCYDWLRWMALAHDRSVSAVWGGHRVPGKSVAKEAQPAQDPE